MTLTIDNLREVRKLLYPIRRKWYDIGVELGLKVNELDNIKAANSDHGECLILMIKKWLKSINPLPTWKALGDAIKEDPVSEVGIAEEAFSKDPQLSVAASTSGSHKEDGAISQSGLKSRCEDGKADNTVLKDPPSWNSVCKELKTVHHKWHDFGVYLGVPSHKMASFKKEDEPLREIIDYWLKGNINDKPVTWQTIITTLRDIEEPKLADKIKAKYTV